MNKTLILILAALLLAACGTSENFHQARIEVEAGNEEEGLARIEQELARDPKNTELRNYYLRHKEVAVQRYLALGDNARAAGLPERAEEAYRRALRFDPENPRGLAGVQAVEKDRAHAALVAEAQAALKAGNEAEATAKLKDV